MANLTMHPPASIIPPKLKKTGLAKLMKPVRFPRRYHEGRLGGVPER
jgi:hypothetical protein